MWDGAAGTLSALNQHDVSDVSGGDILRSTHTPGSVSGGVGVGEGGFEEREWSHISGKLPFCVSLGHSRKLTTVLW